MEALNHQLFLWLNATPASAAWMLHLATFIAKDLIAIVPLLIVGLWLWSPNHALHHNRILVLKTGTALVYALLLSVLIGMLFPHPRPFAIGLGYQWLNHAPDTSFPSDHGTTIFTFALAFICWHRLWSGLVLLVIGVTIAWSRVYLGVHWPIDMLGGLLVGMLGCLSAQLGWQLYGKSLLQFTSHIYRAIFALPIKWGWTRH